MSCPTWFVLVAAAGLTVWSGRPAHAVFQASRKASVPLATEDRVKSAGWWPTQGRPSADEYAGSQVCGSCHGSKLETQQSTPMARAAAKAGNAEVLKNHQHLFRSPGYSYEIASAGNGSIYAVSDGTSSIVQSLSWAFGLGVVGQTYIFEKEGIFYESRVSYYPAVEGLDLTLGHHPPLPNQLGNAPGRAISSTETRLCFGCHTTASTTNNQFDLTHVVPGVGCEACHGPGAKHVAAMREGHIAQGVKLTLNPARLTPVDSVDFCGACHRTTWDVRLGDMAGIATVRFQPYRLEKSRCWGKGDARLTCISCHDPHLPLTQDEAAYDQRCLSCHLAKPGLKITREHPGAACPVSTSKCVSCHMPKYELPGFHGKFTDHWIRIAKPGTAFPD
ncbi:MAG TPA: multiheme c-type cytochrome [Candidatus Angelobacter sp.]|nr:multiheme c-type cytochrome [Candidatus Angelobacter sp.]